MRKGDKDTYFCVAFVKGLPLKIVGDGHLRPDLESLARNRSLDVEFLGALSPKEALSMIGSAALQIVPSECYEGLPMVIIEAVHVALRYRSLFNWQPRRDCNGW